MDYIKFKRDLMNLDKEMLVNAIITFTQILNKEEIVECTTCGELKVSSPTPNGDEFCPNCGKNNA